MLLTLNDGRSAKLTLPKPHHDCESVYAFGLSRSGSTLLNDVLILSAGHAKHVYYSLPNECFDQGIDIKAMNDIGFTPASKAVINSIFERNGYIFGGFRRLWSSLTLHGILHRKKILFVRDPRDVIVSHYFSMRYSHSAPDGTEVARLRSDSKDQTIIDYVLLPEIQDGLLSGYATYDLLPHTNLLVIRYEDYIYDKLKLVNTVLDHLEIEVSPSRRSEIAKTVDVMPENEQVYQHVRNVRPGDHAVKLPTEIVSVLTAKFDPILRKYSYH